MRTTMRLNGGNTSGGKRCGGSGGSAVRTQTHATPMLRERQRFAYPEEPKLEGELVKLASRGRLRDCVRKIAHLDGETKVKVLAHSGFRNKFFERAKRQKSAREAFSLLVTVDDQDSNMEALNYDTRLAKSVLSVCVATNDAATAQKALEHVTSKGIIPDVFLYTTAINAHALKGDTETAVKLFRKAVADDGLMPDAYMYCALVKVFRSAIRLAKDAETKKELLEEALQFIDNMKKSGIVGDVVLYNCIISTCGNADNLAQAEDFFWEMQTLNVSPNSKTYSVLLQACLTAGEGMKALEYFRDAKEQKGMVNAHLCAQAIHAHAHIDTKEDALDTAIVLYKQLELENIRMDGVTKASLVSLAIDLKESDRALNVLDMLIHEGSELTPEPFAVAADLCAKKGNFEGAMDILHKIKELQIIPNKELGASLINAFSKAGDFVNSFKVLEYLLESNMVPNSYSFTGLLYACSYAAEPILALKLYKLAKSRKQLPMDTDIYGVWCSAILHSFLKTQREMYNLQEDTERLQQKQYVAKIITQIEMSMTDTDLIDFEEDYTPEGIVDDIHSIYKDAMRAGYKPSVKVLDMMLECMTTDLYLDMRSNSMDGLSMGSASLAEDGAGLFKKEAFAIFEECSAMGVLPPCCSQSDLEIKVDFCDLAPVVAEVCLLVLLKSLKKRWDSSQGQHAFKSLLLLLPVKSASSNNSPLIDRKVKGLLRHFQIEFINVDENRDGRSCSVCMVRPNALRKVFGDKYDTISCLPSSSLRF